MELKPWDFMKKSKANNFFKNAKEYANKGECEQDSLKNALRWNNRLGFSRSAYRVKVLPTLLMRMERCYNLMQLASNSKFLRSYAKFLPQDNQFYKVLLRSFLFRIPIKINTIIRFKIIMKLFISISATKKGQLETLFDYISTLFSDKPHLKACLLLLIYTRHLKQKKQIHHRFNTELIRLFQMINRTHPPSDRKVYKRDMFEVDSDDLLKIIELCLPEILEYHYTLSDQLVKFYGENRYDSFIKFASRELLQRPSENLKKIFLNREKFELSLLIKDDFNENPFILDLLIRVTHLYEKMNIINHLNINENRLRLKILQGDIDEENLKKNYYGMDLTELRCGTSAVCRTSRSEMAHKIFLPIIQERLPFSEEKKMVHLDCYARELAVQFGYNKALRDIKKSKMWARTTDSQKISLLMDIAIWSQTIPSLNEIRKVVPTIKKMGYWIRFHIGVKVDIWDKFRVKKGDDRNTKPKKEIDNLKYANIERFGEAFLYKDRKVLNYLISHYHHSFSGTEHVDLSRIGVNKQRRFLRKQLNAMCAQRGGKFRKRIKWSTCNDNGIPTGAYREKKPRLLPLKYFKIARTFPDNVNISRPIVGLTCSTARCDRLYLVKLESLELTLLGVDGWFLVKYFRAWQLLRACMWLYEGASSRDERKNFIESFKQELELS